MSWYRKYRPQKIEELNLAKVRAIFLDMLKSGKIPQSLLFAGPKGTGKTSSARIIGALLNDPSNTEVVDFQYLGKKEKKKAKNFGPLQEPDPTTEFSKKVSNGFSYVVQEMDAASHRGIDDIRSLKERVMLPPQEGSMSVYILDEAHMLTTEAFNALLKILEEPPPHVIFILATTELHKIPATIVSRCTTVTFYKASEDEIIEALEKILKNEGIQVEKKALQQIASFADGSFRDAVKLLEQTCQTGSFSAEALESLSGGSFEKKIEGMLEAVIEKDEIRVVNFFEDLRKNGTNQSFFYKMVFQFLHNHLLKSLGMKEGKPFSQQPVIRFLLSQLLEADLEATTPIPFLTLELKLLEIILRAKKKSPQGSDGNQSPAEKPPIVSKVKAPKRTSSETKNEEKKDFIQGEQIQGFASDDGDDISYSQLLFEKWEEFLSAVNSENSSLAALLHSSKPLEGVNGLAKIGVYYRFHQEQLQLPRFKDIIEKCSYDLVGKKVKFDFLLQKTPDSATLIQLDEDIEKMVLARSEAENSLSQPESTSLSTMAADALL